MFARLHLTSLTIAALLLASSQAADPNVLQLRAKNTITAVELNHGDTVKFRLTNGQTRALTLETTAARILERIDEVGTLYEFTANVKIDGHPMTMRRYVCSQETFYEPYVINGLRIWFDAVDDIFQFLTENHGPCKPAKHARFALQDVSMPICPQPLHPWCTRCSPGAASDANYIDIRDCYNGDDPWLGPYNAVDAHGGLDINHDKGVFLYAPIDLDDHWLFNSLRDGQNNNRWRAIRKWPNGDLWTLQSHHLISLTVPEHQPLKAGTQYARTAGVHIGDHPHTHFVFKTQAPNQPEILLDPWILFWQTFEQRKEKARRIRAHIQTLSPARTGQNILFNLGSSRPDPKSGVLDFYWTFGDGASSQEMLPEHTYAKPGIYPITLVVDDGISRASTTQHITVDGPPVERPALAFDAPGQVSFTTRPLDQLDVYGQPIETLPCTLHFYATPARPQPDPKVVKILNVGGGDLPQLAQPPIWHKTKPGWLVIRRSGTGNEQSISLSVSAAKLAPGDYRADVTLIRPKVLNREQQFTVILHVLNAPPRGPVTIDDADPGFSCTPYFWVGHRFHKCSEKGYKNFYLTNGARPDPGRFARFTPLLAAGKYEVSFHEKTPFRPETEFDVLVRSADGDKTVRVNPAKSRKIGTFTFHEGRDGFVQFQTENSKGLVIADAVKFEPIN